MLLRWLPSTFPSKLELSRAASPIYAIGTSQSGLVRLIVTTRSPTVQQQREVCNDAPIGILVRTVAEQRQQCTRMQIT